MACFLLAASVVMSDVVPTAALAFVNSLGVGLMAIDGSGGNKILKVLLL